MSRRRRKRPTLGDRKLPLNSPNWVPLNDAYRQGTARLGSSDFAIADLQRGLKADQDDPLHLHSKMRPLIGAEELLDAAFWHDFGLARWNEGLTLVARTDRRLSGSAVIYVWKPDLEKIWPTEAPASVESFPTDGAAPRRRPGPKPTGDWQIHLAAWLIQIARDDPKRLRNVDRLVADAGTHPDNKKIGWLPQDAKQVRRVIVELLRHVR
jgi:hypothetical protein